MKVDLLSRLGVKILQLEPEDVVQPYRLNLILKRRGQSKGQKLTVPLQTGSITVAVSVELQQPKK